MDKLLVLLLIVAVVGVLALVMAAFFYAGVWLEPNVAVSVEGVEVYRGTAMCVSISSAGSNTIVSIQDRRWWCVRNIKHLVANKVSETTLP